MGNFMGGSAWAMAQQIGDGYILVSERTYKRLERGELDKLAFEMDKLLREIRGVQVPLDDIPAIQQKNRKASRLMGALSQLRQYQQRLQGRARRAPTRRAGARAPALASRRGQSGRPVPPASPVRQLRRRSASRPRPARPSASSSAPSCDSVGISGLKPSAADDEAGRVVVGCRARVVGRRRASLVPLTSASKKTVPWLQIVWPARCRR